MQALRASQVPVPQVYACCEDDAIAGAPFYLMEFLDGRVLVDQSLPGMTPAGRAAVYDEMNRVIAALHRINAAAAGLADFGRGGDRTQGPSAGRTRPAGRAALRIHPSLRRGRRDRRR